MHFAFHIDQVLESPEKDWIFPIETITSDANGTYLVTLLHIGDHFTIWGIYCRKCFSTFRIYKFIVNK